jgi:trans-aconitate 2-methyltransferase
MAKDNYTFGDNDLAGARLRRLTELYEPETRELLQNSGVRTPHLAVDLGCGPGWSTRLLHEVLNPDCTVGLDSSKRYIAEARRNHSADLQFEVHDVVRTPFPVPSPNVLFCRFLLTHLKSLGQILNAWASIAAPGAILFVHETETLATDHPTLLRYYELVGRLQHHYGQTLLVGAVLDACCASNGWRVVESNSRVLRKSASDMAELHLANLRTWRHDAYACRSFDPNEINSLEISLDQIASGLESAGVVVNGAKQIIAQRP